MSRPRFSKIKIFNSKSCINSEKQKVQKRQANMTYSLGARSDENSQWNMRTVRVDFVFDWREAERTPSGVNSSDITASLVQMFLAPCNNNNVRSAK